MAHKLLAMILSLALVAMLCNTASAYVILRRRPIYGLPPVSGAQLRLARAGLNYAPVGPIHYASYGDSLDNVVSPYDNDHVRVGHVIGGRQVVYDTPDYSVNDYGQVQVSY